MPHTPGPWHCGHFADDSHPCNCNGILSECYMGSVAQITIGNGLPISAGGNDGPPLEEAKANGRLIAAAPDLLEALKALQIQALQSDVAKHSNEWGREALEMTRAAIAKATGEQQ